MYLSLRIMFYYIIGYRCGKKIAVAVSENQLWKKRSVERIVRSFCTANIKAHNRSEFGSLWWARGDRKGGFNEIIVLGKRSSIGHFRFYNKHLLSGPLRETDSAFYFSVIYGVLTVFPLVRAQNRRPKWPFESSDDLALFLFLFFWNASCPYHYQLWNLSSWVQRGGLLNCLHGGFDR